MSWLFIKKFATMRNSVNQTRYFQNFKNNLRNDKKDELLLHFFDNTQDASVGIDDNKD